MFVMDYYGHKLSNGVLFAHHLILDVPGGSSHLGYRRRVPPGHNPGTRVNPAANNFRRCILQGRVREEHFPAAWLLVTLVTSRSSSTSQ